MQSGTLARWLIVFDLDGTLVDTAPDLIAALNQTLDSEGLKPVRPNADLSKQAGQGAATLIQYGAAQSGVHYSDEKAEHLVGFFVKAYTQNIAQHSQVFAGVEAMLTRLQRAGARFAICTNKEGMLARKLLKALQLDHWFSAVIGHDEVKNHKPHADHLRHCVSQAGGAMDRTIMIGDTMSDVGAARSAGTPVILVDFGYSLLPVHTLGADAVISKFAELDAIISRLTNRPD